MKLKISKNGLEFSSLIKMVTVGYAVSIIILLFLVILILAITKSADFPVYKILPAIVITPILAIVQGLLIGFAIAFGLFIYRKFRPIEVVTNE